jgi:hypothetical protein
MIDEHGKIKVIGFGQASHSATRRLTFTNLTDELGTVDYVSRSKFQGNAVTFGQISTRWA